MSSHNSSPKKTTLGALACLLSVTALGCANTSDSSSGDSGSSGSGGDQCIILANGGRKLCGSDASAWCQSTDSIRKGNPDLADAQSTCNQIEQANP